MNHSSVIFSSRTNDQHAPTEPIYAHASSTQLPFLPKVVSAADRKRFQEASVLSDDGRSFSIDCGSSVDSCIVGRDVTLDWLCDHSQPDIVT